MLSKLYTGMKSETMILQKGGGSQKNVNITLNEITEDFLLPELFADEV